MSFGEDGAFIFVGFLAVLWASAHVFFPLFQSGRSPVSTASARGTELLLKKERSLKSLEELELDIRTYKLALGDYEREKERLLRQVAQCLTELEALSVGSNEPSHPPF